MAFSRLVGAGGMQRFSKYHLFSLLFFISGFAGIVYESVWTQYLRLITGHAALAQSFILIIFLSGMSAGAWLSGKWSSKIKNLFLYYALAELIIGISALLFNTIFIGTKDLIFETFYPILPQFAADLFEWSLAILITFPQSLLLGATFPLLVGGLLRQFRDSDGRVIADFYFINSLGAVFGILVSGFYLINLFGLPGTIALAGFLNVLIALTVFSVAGKFSQKHAEVVEREAFPNSDGKKKLFLIFIIASFITGATSFMYEIGWIRMLSMVLGSSVQSFELMLSTFILGLAIGSFWIKSRIDHATNLISYFSVVQILMGLLAILSLVLYNYTFNLMEWLMSKVQAGIGGYHLMNLSGIAIACLIMLPATICAGMALPLLIKIAQNAGYGEQSVGKIFAADTAGGILGVVLAFHFLMPLLGMKFLITIAGIIDIGLGVWFVFRFNILKRKTSWPVFMALSAGLLAFILFFKIDAVKMASGVFRYGNINYDNRILYQKDGKTATIQVFETPNGNIVLSTNGKPDASINLYRIVSGDATTQVLLAALPFSINDETESVAIVGLGSGKTAHVALMNFNIRQLDVIEIEPAVAGASIFFKEQVENIFNDSRYKLNIADAKAFFAGTAKKYDLIISEPSNPWIGGIGGMFTYEFYQTIAKSLTDEGVFVQWIHTYKFNMDLMASVFKALSPVFADYQVYYLDDGDLAIIAKKSGKIGWPQGQIFENAALNVELKRIGIKGSNDFWLRLVGDKALLDPFFESFDVAKNSDFYPYLEYNAEKARLLQESATDMMKLMKFPAPVLKLLQGAVLPDNFETGQNYLFTIVDDYKNARIIFNYFDSLTSGKKPDFMGMNEFDAILLNSVLKIENKSDTIWLQNRWASVLDEFAGKIMPFLSKNELCLIWDFILKTNGFRLLPDEIKLKVLLYKAVGECDYAEIVNITGKFLGGNQSFSTSEIDYFKATAIWANLMLDRPDEAVKIWIPIKNQKDAPAMLRFLGNLANKRLSDQKNN